MLQAVVSTLMCSTAPAAAHAGAATRLGSYLSMAPTSQCTRTGAYIMFPLLLAGSASYVHLILLSELWRQYKYIGTTLAGFPMWLACGQAAKLAF